MKNLKKLFVLPLFASVFLLTSTFAYDNDFPSLDDESLNNIVSLELRNGSIIEVSAFAEAFAYLDFDSASDEVRELILEARREIVSNTAWAKYEGVRIVDSNGTFVEEIPLFYDQFPYDWDLNQIFGLVNEDEFELDVDNRSFFEGIVNLTRTGWPGDLILGFTENGLGVDIWSSWITPGNNGVGLGLRQRSNGNMIAWQPRLNTGFIIQIPHWMIQAGTVYEVLGGLPDVAGRATVHVRYNWR